MAEKQYLEINGLTYFLSKTDTRYIKSKTNGATYGLVIPTTTSWTANKTIATENYVDDAISTAITTALNTPV